jgi:branched-chain amino acid aminotransferase
MIVNGELKNSNLLTDAILLGDGVFETLRSYENRIYGLDRHLKRLETGLASIGIVEFDKRETLKSVNTILLEEPLDSGALRISYYADGNLIITHKPYIPANMGISCQIYLEGGVYKNHKSASYSDRMKLRRIAQGKGFDDFLMIDKDGIVSELSTSNLILMLDGIWITPDLQSGCLPGVTRAFLIENFGVNEARITGNDLARASAAAAVSSLREIQEIKSIDGKDFASSQELRELQESFSSWVLGNLLS